MWTAKVSKRVLYNRVLKTKINFEITIFLNYEQWTSRAGNSKSNENTNNKNKNFLVLVFISCFEFSPTLEIQKGGKFKISFVFSTLTLTLVMQFLFKKPFFSFAPAYFKYTKISKSTVFAEISTPNNPS